MQFWPASLSTMNHMGAWRGHCFLVHTVTSYMQHNEMSFHVVSTGAVISMKPLYTTCVKEKRCY